MNTVLYDVHFSDGAMKTYLVNLIAENIIMQFDTDRYHRQLIYGIQNNSKDKLALEKKDWWIVSKLGRQSMRQTTVGWKFHMKWKDRTITWTSLKDLKESNPIRWLNT